MIEYRPGDLVILRIEEHAGRNGVVSRAISPDSDGEVLVYSDRGIAGVVVSHSDVEMAGDAVEGWAQLAHTLIRLGSHIIEQRLLSYRT